MLAMMAAPTKDVPATDDVATAVSAYQNLLQIEKKMLLTMEETADAVVQELLDLQAAGNNRRVSAMEISRSIASLKYRKTVVELVPDNGPFLLIKTVGWNKMRAKAAAAKGRRVDEWRVISMECQRL